MGILNLIWLLRRTSASTNSWLVFFSQKDLCEFKVKHWLFFFLKKIMWIQSQATQVRKDNVLDSFYSLVSQMPKFHEVRKPSNLQANNSKLYSNSSSDAFWSGVPELHAPLQQSRPVIVPSDGHRRRQALRQDGRQELFLQLFYIFLLQVGQNIASDGIMRQSLEMYDEYKQVSTTCKHI